MRRLLTVIWLTVLWVVLWRDASPANVVVGIAVGAGVAGLFTLDWPGPQGHRVRPVAAVKFLGYFAWKLVEANVILAREVVTPQNSIETGIIGVPMTGCSGLVTTVVGNAVSLTPGTLTLEVRRDDDTVRLFVHVLHLHDIERARADVVTLTRLVRAALPPSPSAGVAP